MSSDSEIASAFYPALAAKDAAAAARAPAAPSSEQSLADALYGSMKPKAAPATTPGNRDVDIHDDAAMAKVIHEGSPTHGNALRAIETAAQRELSTPEQAADIAQEWLPFMEKYELSSTESALIAQLGISNTQTPASDESRAAWREDSIKALGMDHGPRAAEALQAAQKMIASDPVLSAWLDLTGLGSHPAVVRVACKQAMTRSKK